MLRICRSGKQPGFTLVMVILLLAVVVGGILGGVAMGRRRHDDAERTKTTRQALPEAFRGLFPHGVGQAGDTRAANLYTDFGYIPDTPTTFQRAGDLTRSWDLRALVDRTQVGVSDGAFATPPPAFNGLNAGRAWNGPYWRGPVDGSRRPLDGWGRILELRYVTSPSQGWTVHSAGANGVDDTPAGGGRPGGDDLLYPDAPYALVTEPYGTYNLQFNFSFVLQDPSSCGGSNSVSLAATLTYLDATQTQVVTLAHGVPLHRKGVGSPPRFDVRDLALVLRSDPKGTDGTIQLAVTGGCPDTILAQSAFNPVNQSLLTYQGSVTSGTTTTYTFKASYLPPPSTGVPWPITIRP